MKFLSSYYLNYIQNRKNSIVNFIQNKKKLMAPPPRHGDSPSCQSVGALHVNVKRLKADHVINVKNKSPELQQRSPRSLSCDQQYHSNTYEDSKGGVAPSEN